MYCKNILSSSIFCLLVLLNPTAALAELITFSFQGEVTSVDPLLAAEFSVGESVVGQYTFESATPDSELADPLQGVYLNAITTFTATFGGDYTITQGVNNAIQVVNNPLGFDRYTPALEDPTGPSVAGLFPGFFFFSLSDSSSTVFDSVALPLSPPNLASFDDELSTLLFFGGQASSVDFELTSFTLIPEPTTTALALAALFLTMSRRRITAR